MNATVTLSSTGTAEPDDAGDMTGDEPSGDDGVVEPDDAGDEPFGDDVTPVPTGTMEPEISRMSLMGVRGGGSPGIWNVSYVAGDDNIISLLDIPGLSAGDTIRIWGDGDPYEGGIIIGVPDVTVVRWEGSPEVPIITSAAGTRAPRPSRPTQEALLSRILETHAGERERKSTGWLSEGDLDRFSEAPGDRLFLE